MAKRIETLDMEEYILTPSSRNVYQGHLDRMDRWLKGREITDGVLADYLAYQFEKGLAPSTAKVSVAAARWRCLCEDKPDPQDRKTALQEFVWVRGV